MKIIKQQQDDEGLGFWHFKIGGRAADDKYRLADLTRETTSPEDWLVANLIEAQNLIDSGTYYAEYALKQDTSEVFKAARQEAIDQNLKHYLIEADDIEFDAWFSSLITQQVGRFLRTSFRYLWGWKEAVDARLSDLEDLQEE